MPESRTPVPQTSKRLSPIPAQPASENGDTLAMLQVDNGLITEAQVIYAKRIKNKLVSDCYLIEIFKELRPLTSQQRSHVLKKQRLHIRTGDLLVEFGSIRKVGLALRRPRSSSCRQPRRRNFSGSTRSPWPSSRSCWKTSSSAGSLLQSTNLLQLSPRPSGAMHFEIGGNFFSCGFFAKLRV